MKRKLDTQAKIFSLSYNKLDTSIFRLSITLKKDINKEALEQSVNQVLTKYKPFKVRLSTSLTNYYLVDNDKKVIIHNIKDNKYQKINTKENNYYLFKIMYYENTIDIDFFHLLTDGNSALSFFKTITSTYISIINNKKINIEPDILPCENSYNTYCQKIYKKPYKYPISYQLKGKKTPTVKTTKLTIALKSLKELSKSKDVSISIILSSFLIYSLYKTNYKKYNGKKPINLCIPINLNNYYKTETISNFVSHMMVSLNIDKSKNYTLDDFISMIKDEFTTKLSNEEVLAITSSNHKSVNNSVVNYIPLFIKKPLVVLGSFFYKKHFTITLTNLGNSNIEETNHKYIDSLSFILPPDWAERIRVGVCSLGNDLVLTFNSNIVDNDLELYFKKMLKDKNITYKEYILQ